MQKWTSFFDYDSGLITVILSDRYWKRPEKSSWITTDESISDPEGRFIVFIDCESMADVAFKIKMRKDSNIPDVVHKSFNTTILSSPTIWVPTIDKNHNHLRSLSHLWISNVESPWLRNERPRSWEVKKI
jgi:hypothetical protein